ncbi:MAG: Phosphoribosylformylglycinamidine synthase, partial [Microgenomates group bacterium GW2011_GWA2_46_7]
MAHAYYVEKGLPALREFEEKVGLSLWPVLEEYIFNYFVNILKRNPTDVEIFMFGQLNSEHCRHHLFNGLFIIDGEEMPNTLLGMIKSTMAGNQGNIVVAFKDNAAVMAPRYTEVFVPEDPCRPSCFVIKPMRYCFVFKIETHNHPTTISPYAGAATGVAVRRDIFGTGRGGIPVVHLACYYVENLFIPGYPLPWEKRYATHPERFAEGLQIVIEASNGASDDSNCFGNPVIFGSCTSFYEMVGPDCYGYTKTALVAGSFGYTREEHIEKEEPRKGLNIVEMGGKAFKIGLGGGSGSSRDAGAQGVKLDFDSVQRADPAMEKANSDVFLACVMMGENNPIRTTTDLGAGGCCVAIPELLHPAGGRVDIRKIPCGDSSIPVYIIFCNESQERMVVLIADEDLEMFMDLCERNRCPAHFVGEVTDDRKFVLEDSVAGEDSPREEQRPIDVESRFLLADLPQVKVDCKKVPRELSPFVIPDVSLWDMLDLVLRLLKVGSKHFLTRKADRSVGGKVAQQPTVGPLQLSLADFAIMADSLLGNSGTAMAIGEQPIVGLVDTCAGGRMSIAEALLNLVWAAVDGFDSIDLSATWQWPCKQPGEDARLYATVKAVTDFCKALGIRIAVGKDSVSMTAWAEKDGQPFPVKAPGTVQIIAHAPCLDVLKKVAPDIKRPDASKLMFLDFSGGGKQRMGGSALAQVFNQVGDEAPDADADLIRRGFEAIQELIRKGLILSGHDRSDGGLVTCLLEMAFAGNCGLDMDFRLPHDTNWATFLFNQECGAVIEFLPEKYGVIRKILQRHGLKGCYHTIGRTIKDKHIHFFSRGYRIFSDDMPRLRSIWQETSFQLDALQANPEVVAEERKNIYGRPGPLNDLTFQPFQVPNVFTPERNKPKVIVLREIGINGDAEMAFAFGLAGFQIVDAHMTDLLEGRVSFGDIRGLVAPGGFTFGDTLDAGKGEAGVMKFNPRIADQVMTFINRPDTFALGVCNGCQLFALLGLVPWQGIPTEHQPRFITNTSEIFESRFVSVLIEESKSIFFRDMVGSTLGVWVAHAQGRLYCPDGNILKEIDDKYLAPIRYVDDYGDITEAYPFNPNGSPLGIAGLCSPDGRVTALMPHPERLVRLWQWPYIPPQWEKLLTSPWLRMFQSAYDWCKAA